MDGSCLLLGMGRCISLLFVCIKNSKVTMVGLLVLARGPVVKAGSKIRGSNVGSFMGLAHLFNKTLWCVMVENTNSTILEVQGSFGLTYMVGFIPLNLRSQEIDKGVPHARRRRRGPGSGQAWRGEAGRRRAGVVWLIFSTH
jgi:hypothetical protein